MKNYLKTAYLSALSLSSSVPSIPIVPSGPSGPSVPSVIETRRNHLKKLYGDWLVWHSDHPQFSGRNSNILSIYPKRELAVRRYSYFGPFYCSILMRGRFKNLYSFEESCSGCFNGSNDSEECQECNIKVEWYEEDTCIDSIFGIGVNEWKQIVVKKPISMEMNMTINLLDINDIYISTWNYNIHLIRNLQPNPVSSNSGTLSSFLFSQILGNLFILGLHTYFRDFF